MPLIVSAIVYHRDPVAGSVTAAKINASTIRKTLQVIARFWVDPYAFMPAGRVGKRAHGNYGAKSRRKFQGETSCETRTYFDTIDPWDI